jgi:hypothetical protein
VEQLAQRFEVASAQRGEEVADELLVDREIGHVAMIVDLGRLAYQRSIACTRSIVSA